MSVASGAKRPRVAWCLRVFQIGTDYEMALFYKNSRSTLTPFSRSPQNATVKIPWGPPEDCVFGTADNEGITEHYFRFGRGRKNSDTVKFNVSTMNSLLAGVNEFSQCVQRLVAEGQLVLLSNFLSLLPKSEGFTYHQTDIFDSTGIRSDGQGIQERDLVDAGGSLLGFRAFLESAKASATPVETPLTNKRKTGDKTPNINVAPSKKAKITPMTRFVNEIKEEDGIERKYANSFIGSFDVSLGSLSVDPMLRRKLNFFHTQGIKKEMTTRFDPSLLCITVRPVDVSSFNSQKPEDSEYYVVQGIHSFEALVAIEKEGIKLPGICNGLYTVCMVNTEDKELILYGNVRSNSLASVFVRKPQPQDLLKIYGQMMTKQGLKLVERMARLQLIGVAETKAILDLCKWPDDAVKSLIVVLEKFEKYDTEDIKEHKRSTVHLNVGKMNRGEFHTLSNKLLIKLSKVTPAHFLYDCANVLNKEKSLRALIIDFETSQEIAKVVKLVENMGKCQIQELNARYSDKFNEDILEQFIGAEISELRSNVKGELLKQYYDSVIKEQGEESSIELRKINTSIQDTASEVIANCGLVVVHFSSLGEEEKRAIFDEISTTDVKSIFLFPNETEQLDALMYLRTMKQSESFQVQQIFFDKPECLEEDGVGCNLEFGILCGNLTKLFDGPVNNYNGKLSNLRTMMCKINPPGSKIVSITDENTNIIPLHMKDLARPVLYCSFSNQLETLKTLMTEEGTFMHKTDEVAAAGSQDIEMQASNGDTTSESINSTKTHDTVSRAEVSLDSDEVQGLSETDGTSALESQCLTKSLSTPTRSPLVSQSQDSVSLLASQAQKQSLFEFQSPLQSHAPTQSSVESLPLSQPESPYDSNSFLTSTPQPPTGISVENGRVIRFFK